MSLYPFLKHLHLACVVVSITGFLVRGGLAIAGSSRLRRGWWRWAPHVNDTLLLAAAIGLVVVTGQYPFVDAWVTAKVFGLIAYIILGSIALKADRSRRVRVAAWLGALVVFGYIVSVALTRSTWGVLALLG